MVNLATQVMAISIMAVLAVLLWLIAAALRKNKHIKQLVYDSASTQEALTALKSQFQQQLLENTKTAEQLRITKEQYQALQSEYANVHVSYQRLISEHAQLKTSMVERDRYHKAQLEDFGEQKKALSKEFEGLAARIFEEKGRVFTSTSQDSLSAFLKPFREQIAGFQKRVDHIHADSIKGSAQLNAELRKVLEIGLKMSDEANSLTQALKGSAQQRGAWGEVQLKRTLELSGLIENDHYEAQSDFKDASGKNKRTDYLIKLPDSKHIIIDSKVSLLAYDQAVSAQTEEEAEEAICKHIKSVKRHIDELASKEYTNLTGVHSPSFVLMFMPIEPAYIEALKRDKALFSYGYDKGVVLVSHTTLVPILRTVANLWVMERSNNEAREISEKAGDIYNQACVVAERLQKLGGALTLVSKHYNSAVTAVVGQQGLYGKIERFKTCSNKVNKKMPVLESAHLDFESDRLAFVVEPLVDEAVKEPAAEEAESGR